MNFVTPGTADIGAPTFVGGKVENPVEGEHRTCIGKTFVDTSSEFTWISTTALENINIIPEKKAAPFVRANGQMTTRDIDFAIIRVDKHITIEEVIFVKQGDLQL